MSKLDSAMVIYGAIDEIAMKARDPKIIEALKKYFPAATGIDERGWYGEFKRMCAPGSAAGRTTTAADITAALKDLATVTLASAAPDANAVTAYDLKRLYFVTGVLNELRRMPETQSDTAVQAFFAFDADDLKAVRTHIESLGIPKLGDVPPKCDSNVRKVHDEYCTVLLTDSQSKDVTLNQLKAVLDPSNWPKLSTFFQRIEIRPTNARGWGRMLEVVETGSGNAFTLKTPLKYWKGTIESNGGVFINYDMDDDAFDDPTSDHLVLIDNGFIVALPQTPNEPDEPGVRLITSKELLIRGMSPTAAANLACRLGWADAGDHMFFDTANKLANPSERDKEDEEWTRWSASMTPWDESHEDLTAPIGPGVGRRPPETWTLPAQNRKQMIDTAAAEVQAMVTSTFGSAGRFLQRWQDGLTPEEIAETGTDLGTELTRSYQTVFTTAMDAVRPATRRS